MEPRSDALVIFGVTGDLAFRKIFPALQNMVRRGVLDVPVIGVAREGSVQSLRERIAESLEAHGGVALMPLHQSQPDQGRRRIEQAAG